jgi:hypothetical protein
MLKLHEGHMNGIHVQMMNQQDLMKVISIIIKFNLMDIYIQTKAWFPHKHIHKNKINDSLKIIYCYLVFEKLLALKKSLYWKII